MDIAEFSLDLFSLAGRNALVTGGNTGLGRAFSVALAKAGADLFAVGLAEDDGTTRRLIEDAGRRMEFMLADITQPGVPAAIVRRCVEALGSIDILVNSAGIALLSDVEAFGRDQWDLMVSVNLTAAFELAHEASTFIIEQRSGIVAISPEQRTNLSCNRARYVRQPSNPNQIAQLARRLSPQQLIHRRHVTQRDRFAFFLFRHDHYIDTSLLQPLD